MPSFSKKGISLLAAIVLLTIGVAIIPEIIGEDMKVWCQQNLGPNYKGWLIGFFVVGTAVLVYLTTDFGKSEKKTEQTPLTPAELETYRTGIREWLKSRYELRLEQKMAGRLPINLSRLASTEGASEFRAETFEEIPEDKIQGKITELFHEAKGRLLILGAPGAGKTTLMLQLALGLLDADLEAIPVVVDLATWSEEFKILKDWLKKILPAELGASNALTQNLLERGQLTLLFDGLDEVNPRYEEYLSALERMNTLKYAQKDQEKGACLRAIGAFGTNAVNRYAISSRKKEYLYAASEAPVRFQIEVGPLKIAQIESELIRRGYNQPEDRLLLIFLKNNKLAREASEVPFYFNCLQLLFAQGLTPKDLHFRADTRERQEVEIIDRFIKVELKKCINIKSEQWLSFLASRMDAINKYNKNMIGYFKDRLVQFELKDLQYGWWGKWRGSELFISTLISFVSGFLRFVFLEIIILFGFFGALFKGNLLTGVYAGLSILVLLWILSILTAINDSWYHKRWAGISPKFSTLRFVKPVSLFSLKKLGSYLSNIVAWLLFGFSIGLLNILVKQLFGFLPKTFNVLYLGYLLEGLFAGLLTGLLSCLFDIIKGFIKVVEYPFIKIITPYQHFSASLKSLDFSILEHFLLRYQLSKNGLLPLRTCRFSERNGLLSIRKGKAKR